MNTRVTAESTTRGRKDHARRGTTRVLITLTDVPTTITRPREKDSHSSAVTATILDEFRTGSSGLKGELIADTGSGGG
jgi:hypothetical protein